MSPLLLSAFLCGLLAAAYASNNTYTLLAHLSKQSDTLAHGLKLANKLGNLGRSRIRGTVAFVAASYPNDRAYSGSSDVKFPRVVTNVGNAYSAHTGQFRAPVDGVYVFEWSINSYRKSHANIPAIYVNGRWKLSAFCLTASSTSHDTCTKTAPLQLRRGDVVSIRSFRGTLYVDGTYSSFSGWLL